MALKEANPLLAGLEKHFSAKQLASLRAARVGIAGAGGLGSNTAMLLARSGIGRLVLADHDRVEPSNLNRQHFWPEHLGKYKTEAMARQLLLLNPALELELLPVCLTRRNLPDILAASPIWVEALDCAESKAMFVELALLQGCTVVAASGLCGFGGQPMLKKKLANLVMVGDFETGDDEAPPLAPRVMQAAALMADSVLEFILAPATV